MFAMERTYQESPVMMGAGFLCIAVYRGLLNCVTLLGPAPGRRRREMFLSGFSRCFLTSMAVGLRV